MSEQEKIIAVVDPDSSRAEQTASLIRFLDFDIQIAADESELEALVAQLPQVVAVLVAADTDFRTLIACLSVAATSRLNCPCYLMDRQGLAANLPPGLANQIESVISDPVLYKELLAVLQQVEFLSHSHSHSSDSTKGGLPSKPWRNLVGCSRNIESVRHLVGQVASTEASVLILGESGTGKEVIARGIHEQSNRRNQLFVPINCGAIPAELLESELFGHEKGAFTGAVSSRQGRFEIAEGGTLFLDEIGDMPLDMQVKLLRVLQERTFERVGSNKTMTSNVRIIAATHQNLEQLAAEGKFRMDLYFRLNVFPIEVSPLRERPEDIPLLVKTMMNQLALDRRGSPILSDSVLSTLSSYSWMGNVRELFNLIERLAILYPQQMVKRSDLPEKFLCGQDSTAVIIDDAIEQPRSASVAVDASILPADGTDLKHHLAEIEKNLITQALEQSDWIVARACKLLNLRRTTLVEKMRKIQINRPGEATIF
jgi:sigma-54 specific flagellar transcriptional regulator A